MGEWVGVPCTYKVGRRGMRQSSGEKDELVFYSGSSVALACAGWLSLFLLGGICLAAGGCRAAASRMRLERSEGEKDK